jgi:DNA repair exonuclease SbcCD ATPase subunit
MKVISLEADSFKRLKAVRIAPSGHLVEITGENGEGKSSTLDAIWAALGGKDAVPEKPIHTGADKAEIRLALGEAGETKLLVTRRFKLKDGAPFTTDLIVESAEGARFAKAQGVLDALVGELCFDPLAFTRMKPAEQIEALRKFVPGVDFAKIEGLNKRDYDDRTDVNRRAKQLRAEIAALPPGPDALPERVDTAALEAELARAAGHNAMVERAKGSRQRDADALREREDRIKLLQVQIEQLQAECATLRERYANADPLPAAIDTDDVQRKLAEGRQTNAILDAADRRFALDKNAAELEAEADTLTQRIEERTAQAATAVQKAKMPIEGLGFGEGIVTLNGEPFAQASKAQQIRASVAIAAAMNPKLRVAFVADGSLLDRHSWAALEEYAAAQDMQIWCETVTPHTAAAIHIEDGGVRGAAAPPPAATDDDVI